MHVIDDSKVVDVDEKEGDDQIGFATIPLRGLLVDHKKIEGRFEVFNSKNEHVGLLVIEIVITDPISQHIHAKTGFGLTVGEQWEKEFIHKMCLGVAKTTYIRDVDSIFNIFS